jgi:hypothetical protein
VITGLVLGAFAWLVANTVGLIPAVPVPAWLTSSGGSFSTVFAAAGSMGAWFPVAFVLSVMLAVLAVWVVSFGIKLVRMVISHLTGGGGGT